jgi:NDP-sugar pyrophosphorylase family protein
MQAVILAGGLGVRLWPLTKDVPKPMAPIAGTPYLEYQLRLLKQQAILDIVLLTGYLGDQIESYFGDGGRFGLSIRYSREKAPLGTGGALREAEGLLSETFLVIYGDSYLPIEYKELLKELGSSGATGVVAIYDNRIGDTSVRNNVAIDESNRVILYDKESVDNPALTHVEAGVLAFRRRVLELLPAAGKVSLESEIFPRLIARKELLAWPTRQRFYDIGTPERLHVIEGLLTS